MTNKTYFKTTEKTEVNNYPYGRLQCTAFFGLEFKPGKGFRTTFQTINPKTGRLNAVKNSTYSPILVMYKDAETGHIKYDGCDLYGDEGINKAAEFMAEHFDLFTTEQIKDICGSFFLHLKASVKAQVIYCGSNFEDLKPLFAQSIDAAVKGINMGNNVFKDIKLNIEAINACKVEGYNPFKVTKYELN